MSICLARNPKRRSEEESVIMMNYLVSKNLELWKLGFRPFFSGSPLKAMNCIMIKTGGHSVAFEKYVSAWRDKRPGVLVAYLISWWCMHQMWLLMYRWWNHPVSTSEIKQQELRSCFGTLRGPTIFAVYAKPPRVCCVQSQIYNSEQCFEQYLPTQAV